MFRGEAGTEVPHRCRHRGTSRSGSQRDRRPALSGSRTMAQLQAPPVWSKEQSSQPCLPLPALWCLATLCPQPGPKSCPLHILLPISQSSLHWDGARPNLLTQQPLHKEISASSKEISGRLEEISRPKATRTALITVKTS